MRGVRTAGVAWGLLFGLVGLVVAAPAAAQSGGRVCASDPAAVVRRYVAAVNAEDLAAALACLDVDAAYAGGVGWEFIRARLERDFAVNRRITITSVQVSGERVTWSWEATEDPYGRLGVPPIVGTDEAIVRDGVIVFNGGAVDEESVRRQQAAIPSAVAAMAAGWQAQMAAGARATEVAESGLLGRLPDTQARGTPPTVPWMAPAVVALGMTVALAALRRPSSV